MERSTENLVGTVQTSPLTPAMRDQQVGVIAALPVPVKQWCIAILTLQLTVSQQGTQGGATGHGAALCFIQV